MNVELSVGPHGIVYEVPGVPANFAKWLDMDNGGQAQGIIYSEDALSLDDKNKVHYKLTVVRERL